MINIITKSRSLEGYKIGLLQRVGHGKHFRSYFQANGYYKIDKWMFQTSYGIRPWAWGGRNEQTRTNLAWDALTETSNRFRQENRRLDHNYDFRTTYQLPRDSRIGFQYTGSYVDGDKEAWSNRTAVGNAAPGFTIDSRVQGPYRQRSNTATAYWHKALDTLGSSLQVTAQYSGFYFLRQESIAQVLAQESRNTPIDRRSENLNDIDILTWQADYKSQIGPNLAWESGFKNASIRNKSAANLVAEQAGGGTTLLPEFSNDFRYREHIMAGYSQLDWTHGNTTLNVGLRAEWTQTDLASDSGEANANRSYFNLFPSASLRRNFSDKASAQFSYSYRINRPLFQDLNPYVLFVDSLISLRGNPLLVPEYSHNLAASIQWSKWNLGLSYVFNRNKINQVFRSLDPNNPEVISFVKENLDHTTLWMANLSRSFSHGSYSAYCSLGIFFDDHQIWDVEQTFANRKPGYFLQLNQSVELPWQLKLEAVFNYTSSRVDGVYTDNPISYLNVSLSRRLLQNQLRISLWGNDVFNKFRWTGTTNFNLMQATYLSEGDFHYVRLSLNWDFGKLGTQALQARQVSGKELGRINRNQN